MAKQNKTFLIGYRKKGISLYKTPLKPLGYVVAGLGFVSLGIGIIPDALILLVYPKALLVGIISFPLGSFLLGLVGIRFNKRKILNKFRFTRRFL